MSLRNQLEEKLLLVRETANKSELAYKYCFNLIKSYLIKELLDNEFNRTFALKKVALEDNAKVLLKLFNYYKLFENHKEVILSKEELTNNALILLDELIEQFKDLIVEIQSLTIFLENRLKGL